MATPPTKSDREKEAEEIARMTRAWESVTISSSQKDRLARLSRVVENSPRREVEGGEGHLSGEEKKSVEVKKGGEEEGEGRIDFPSGKKIDTSHTFYLWFDHMHKELEEEEERIYTNYIHRLECYEDLCNQLVKEVEKGMDNLSHMQHQFEQVSAKANLLREACDIIMREKAGLVAFVDSIEEKLRAYDQLSVVEGKVDRFMEKNPLHSDLVALLGNLDECSSFIQQSTNYHKSEVYRSKFQQVYSRALALVKLFVVSNIRSHTSSLARQIQSGAAGNNSRDSYHHIVTTTMRRLAASLRPLFVEIERRGRTESYANLLVDCQYAYFNERRRLVAPHLSRQMEKTVLSSSLKEVVRTACGLLIHTAQTEHQLVSLFFHSAHQGLEELLSSFSGVVYEHIRPFVLKSSLDDLCAVASVIQSEVMHEQLARRKDITAPIAPMFQRILQDVQERLVFLVLMFIRNDIGGYVPTPHDLAYPERLKGGGMGKWEGVGGSSMNGHAMQLLKEGQQNGGDDKGKEKEGQVVVPATPGDGEVVVTKGLREVYEGWFPTLGRSLVVLSKIYEVLDRKIFEELANDIVCDCTASLMAAAAAIGTRSGEAHGSLFLLKHLVILREQISPFDVEFSRVERRLDFSSSFNGIFGLSVAVSSFLKGQWSDGWKSVWGKFFLFLYFILFFLFLSS